ncbi:2-hydroxyacid dehydrogenase [Ureibacillus sp. GCM10028918]|uniref:2-hydroxyacid dehydrogenase n=1 Tax=Ureibacillus sp. GCM10028918 TaxID=3273429 RepID=UPI00361DD735
MNEKIIVYRKVDEQVLNYLRDYAEVVYFEKLTPENMDEFYSELETTTVLLGSLLKIDESILNKAPNLKMVANSSVGYDNLDLQALKSRGIIASNTPEVLNETVADTIFGLILSTARRMPELVQWVKNGEWNENLSEEYFGVDVHHKKLGIIGMGRIGQTLAQRAHFGFGMDIYYHNRSRNLEVEERFNATFCTLDELLSEVDFVCLLTPLTKETEKMMGYEQFKKMKQSAIFINASRGKTVDEEGLIQALQEREILAAGLDVYEKEPVDKNSPLLSMKNVVTLPHIGSATSETRLKMTMLAAQNAAAFLTGNEIPSEIKIKLEAH